MTKPGKKPPAEVKAGSGDGTAAYVPVAEMYIDQYPVVVFEVKSDDIYPDDARRMGIEGVVLLKVGIDEKGNVVQVKVIERGGHGFDEAAVKALRQFRFKPAIAKDGRPVPFPVTYTYRFTLSQ